MRTKPAIQKIRKLQKDIILIDKTELQRYLGAWSHGDKTRLGILLRCLGIKSKGNWYILDRYFPILGQVTDEFGSGDIEVGVGAVSCN